MKKLLYIQITLLAVLISIFYSFKDYEVPNVTYEVVEKEPETTIRIGYLGNTTEHQTAVNRPRQNSKSIIKERIARNYKDGIGSYYEARRNDTLFQFHLPIDNLQPPIIRRRDIPYIQITSGDNYIVNHKKPEIDILEYLKNKLNDKLNSESVNSHPLTIAYHFNIELNKAGIALEGNLLNFYDMIVALKREFPDHRMTFVPFHPNKIPPPTPSIIYCEFFDFSKIN